MHRLKVSARRWPVVALVSAFSILGGCATGPQVPAGPAAVSAPASISADALVGRWGVAAYHRDSDRPRTEAEARRQCNNPYNITRGPNGGVIMHLADQSSPQELVLKGGADGANYLGLPGAPGAPDDREIILVSDKSFTAKFVNPENANRYGTMIYIRCG
jgi:hypothetical protein